ncbi:MAG: CDP-diacylglycerol--serine O-phosphatidyltransferase [Crocinitomicaceae bacterium]
MIPNLLTAGNLIGGILAIIAALTGHLELAPYFILISAVLDFLDGFVARLLQVQSELGKQLDSLADMVTFGVAPGIIVYQFFLLSLRLQGLQEYNWLAYAAFLLPVSALFRLAKFNLDNRQTDHFIGLPTPAMTLFFATFPLLFHKIEFLHPLSFEFCLLSWLGHPVILIFLIVLFSVLMLLEIPLFALKFKHFKWKGNEIRYVFLTISVVLLATLFVWALPLIIVLYLILSVINNFIRKQSETKSAKDEIQS